ncbi:Uncharacterised protein [Mycobacteroides abscessus subsp. bolletii]|nr:hypothetical protein XW60_05930 [Mycobacteroides abscessus subsp. bolletii]SKS50316.1 Uncharacterised protein [Mycobacteroides abscessus subsp. bolletii]SLE12087.1 Uncharacterised protein [Mycobacteroides abscessus subsp. bolletii]
MAEKIGLPLLGLVSGWLLAVWKGGRHRSWESLSSDLDLADKLQVYFPKHAEWLRMSVAARLKGRGISDSRPRMDPWQAVVGICFVAAGFIGTMVFKGDLSHPADKSEAFGNIFFTLAMLFTVVAGSFILVRDGFTARFRPPGISDLLMPGHTKQERKRLGDEFEQLHDRAKNLPNPAEIAPHDSEDDSDSTTERG